VLLQKYRKKETELDLAELLPEVFQQVEHRLEQNEKYNISSLEELETNVKKYDRNDDLSSESLPWIPGMPSLPTFLPFDFCVDPPGVDEVCSTFSSPTTSNVSCAVWDVNKFSFEIAQGPDLEVEDGEIGGSIEWSTFGWIAFSPSCVYIGQSIGDYELWCTPVSCYSWPAPTSVPEVANEVVDVAEDIVDAFEDFTIDLPTIISIVLVIIVAVAIAILIVKPPTGVPA